MSFYTRKFEWSAVINQWGNATAAWRNVVSRYRFFKHTVRHILVNLHKIWDFVLIYSLNSLLDGFVHDKSQNVKSTLSRLPNSSCFISILACTKHSGSHVIYEKSINKEKILFFTSIDFASRVIEEFNFSGAMMHRTQYIVASLRDRAYSSYLIACVLWS